jgi:hypothetical protein
MRIITNITAAEIAKKIKKQIRFEHLVAYGATIDAYDAFNSVIIAQIKQKSKRTTTIKQEQQQQQQQQF